MEVFFAVEEELNDLYKLQNEKFHKTLLEIKIIYSAFIIQTLIELSSLQVTKTLRLGWKDMQFISFVCASSFIKF